MNFCWRMNFLFPLRISNSSLRFMQWLSAPLEAAKSLTLDIFIQFQLAKHIETIFCSHLISAYSRNNKKMPLKCADSVHLPHYLYYKRNLFQSQPQSATHITTPFPITQGSTKAKFQVFMKQFEQTWTLKKKKTNESSKLHQNCGLPPRFHL